MCICFPTPSCKSSELTENSMRVCERASSATGPLKSISLIEPSPSMCQDDDSDIDETDVTKPSTPGISLAMQMDATAWVKVRPN